MKTFLHAIVLAAGFAVCAAAETPVVTIDSGKIAGQEAAGMTRFLGIPYAAPPIGDLRWRAPQAVKPWEGVRDANAFGPVCRQTADWVKAAQSEDCLTLNVWAPTTKANKPYPVMVWIHGGGLVSGYGSEWGPEGGKSIVQKGMILVSINYRLGVFGFFAHPALSAEAADHASGNQGFRDQIAALQWIQRNIAKFGGDPNNVTIGGCSAGGSSVAALTISPLAKGLFQRGISESGVVGPIPTLAAAQQRGVDLGQTLKAPQLSALRNISAEELLKQPWIGMPNLDGATFPELASQSFASGHQNHVPVLLGWNADEGIDLASDVLGSKEITAAIYPRLLQKLFGPQIPPVILAQYPGKTDAEALASAQRLVTDMIGLEHFGWAVMQEKTKTEPVYLYQHVPGAKPDFQDARALQIRQGRAPPILPAPDRDNCGNEIIAPCEAMIKVIKEPAHEFTHTVAFLFSAMIV